jgi:uncharacterized membrane protein YccF (DUF307 family)
MVQTQSNAVVYEQTNRPGCLIQLLWFVFIGSWFGLIWVAVAWFLNLTIIGLPLGAAMLNNVPQIMALRGKRVVQVDTAGRVSDAPQLPFILRALYFLVIGWWFSAIWLVVAYVLCMTVIGLPFGFLMFDLVPTLTTLKRS